MIKSLTILLELVGFYQLPKQRSLLCQSQPEFNNFRNKEAMSAQR